ncbi:hypothetical protein [Saccharomonospora saliphila]|uniref:hypothetical protein n=1 Tax=Saccharomonospora saliphila TaxID=369829 RepID=UPI000377A787|nr:hypothetical protein [Saccharomonospora saliphila]
MYGCAFLPLTTRTAAHLCRCPGEDTTGAAMLVRRRAADVEAAAARCWAVLLAGCATPVRKDLSGSLHALSEATEHYVGTRWWFSDGSVHRHRVARARTLVEYALAESDGGEFARAFVSYDHATASAVVCAREPDRSTTG